MKVIYVAGAFRAETQWGIHRNVLKAEEVGLQLWKMGFVPIVPHKLTEFYQGECADSVWLDGCIELLKRCDIVFTVKGWENSRGAREEVKIALRLGIPIYDGIAEIPLDK